MSSSSSQPKSEVPVYEPGEADNLWLARLLGVLAGEVASLGDAITGVGDALSERALNGGQLKGVKEIQAFDALSQLARAQAALIGSIGAQLQMPVAEMRAVLEARISELPVFSVRERVMQAAGIAATNDPPGVPAGDDETQWFE